MREREKEREVGIYTYRHKNQKFARYYIFDGPFFLEDRRQSEKEVFSKASVTL